MEIDILKISIVSIASCGLYGQIINRFVLYYEGRIGSCTAFYSYIGKNNSVLADISVTNPSVAVDEEKMRKLKNLGLGFFVGIEYSYTSIVVMMKRQLCCKEVY